MGALQVFALSNLVARIAPRIRFLGRAIEDIVSLTVIGADVLEADRFATAAFAMGKDGIYFIEQTPGLEGYAVDYGGRATPTSGFGDFCAP